MHLAAPCVRKLLFLVCLATRLHIAHSRNKYFDENRLPVLRGTSCGNAVHLSPYLRDSRIKNKGTVEMYVRIIVQSRLEEAKTVGD